MNKECEQLHKCLMLIANEIKRICEKNNIQYFLIGGTLLGAIRHKGFIPWDDDLDIGMLREDYNRFIDVCKIDLEEQFILCSLNTESAYNRPFAKLRLKNTSFPDYGQSEKIHHGIYVDIFPIDVMPKNFIKQRYQNLFIKLWRNTVQIKLATNRSSKKLKFIYWVLTPFRLLPKQVIVKKLVKWETKYNDDNNFVNYINFSSNYPYGKEIFPKSSISEGLTSVTFENVQFTVPKNYEYILTHLYGDYMKLPPKEQRVYKHANGCIDFGSYEKI